MGKQPPSVITIIVFCSTESIEHNCLIGSNVPLDQRSLTYSPWADSGPLNFSNQPAKFANVK